MKEKLIENILEAAMDEWPWDAGYRADFYRSIATELLELAGCLDGEF